MKLARLLVLAAVLLLVASFFVFDLNRYLDLEYFQSNLADFRAWKERHLAAAIGLYFLAYVAVTSLSLPGALVLSLGAGALFGLVIGSALVAAAASVGALGAFLAARFVLRESVERRFGAKLTAINRGVEKDGAFYLFTLRLVPVFPFFVINLVMALTKIRAPVFFTVSMLGMLPGTVVFVNAGAQLAQIDSLGGIVSWPVLLSFALLGIFPLAAKKILEAVRARRVYRGHHKPRRFDANLVVIGAGSAGLVASYIAAALKARVTLIERGPMGGDCLNSGCVPSKALLRSAKFLAEARKVRELGLKSAAVDFDFADIMARVRRVIAQIAPHDSVERYTGLGVHCIAGEAAIKSPWEVQVNGQTIHTRAIIIATGAGPLVPPIPGVEQSGCRTFDTLWEIDELPRRLLVLGGGPAGCEMAQAFARFGSEVTQVEMMPRLMAIEDEDASMVVQKKMMDEGVRVLANHKAVEFRTEGGRKELLCQHQGKTVAVEYDQALLALGRRANTKGFGLEELNMPLTRTGTVEVDDCMQTRYPNIYACGDVAWPWQFTHSAAYQARFAAVNALFGGWWKFRAAGVTMPWATFTDPEVARVGLNEQEAKRQGIAHEVARYDLAELDRAITDERAHGFVKVLTVPGKDRILGATIVGEHAGDLIMAFVSAMKHGHGLGKILDTIHPYPTLAESAMFTAGVWKRAHTPQRALEWVGRYHRLKRGR